MAIGTDRSRTVIAPIETGKTAVVPPISRSTDGIVVDRRNRDCTAATRVVTEEIWSLGWRYDIGGGDMVQVVVP